MSSLSVTDGGGCSETHKTTAAALDVLVTLTAAPALPHLNLSPG